MRHRIPSSGLLGRIVATIVLLTGGVVFVILFLAFWASQFAWYQNLAVVLVTPIVVIAGLALLWVSWAMGWRSRFGSAAGDPGHP